MVTDHRGVSLRRAHSIPHPGIGVSAGMVDNLLVDMVDNSFPVEVTQDLS